MAEEFVLPSVCYFFQLFSMELLQDNRALLENLCFCRNILKNLTLAYGQMILKSGFFHADPHPGNILICKDLEASALITFESRYCLLYSYIMSWSNAFIVQLVVWNWFYILWNWLSDWSFWVVTLFLLLLSSSILITRSRRAFHFLQVQNMHHWCPYPF